MKPVSVFTRTQLVCVCMHIPRLPNDDIMLAGPEAAGSGLRSAARGLKVIAWLKTGWCIASEHWQLQFKQFPHWTLGWETCAELSLSQGANDQSPMQCLRRVANARAASQLVQLVLPWAHERTNTHGGVLCISGLSPRSLAAVAGKEPHVTQLTLKRLCKHMGMGQLEPPENLIFWSCLSLSILGTNF